MKPKMPFRKKAQHTIEYAAVICLVMVGIVLMRNYIYRSVWGHLKMWEDGAEDSLRPPIPIVTVPPYEPPESMDLKVTILTGGNPYLTFTRKFVDVENCPLSPCIGCFFPCICRGIWDFKTKGCFQSHLTDCGQFAVRWNITRTCFHSMLNFFDIGGVSPTNYAVRFQPWFGGSSCMHFWAHIDTVANGAYDCR